MTTNTSQISKEILENLYLIQKKSQRDIAKELGDNRSHIRYYLKKFNIPQRSISDSKIGINKGRKVSEEIKKQISKTLKGKYTEEKSWHWKGDKVNYVALHDWVKKHKPKLNKCQKCGSINFIELSNISGEYKRDLNDYQWLCKKCHHKYDKEHNIWGFSLLKFKNKGEVK